MIVKVSLSGLQNWTVSSQLPWMLEKRTAALHADSRFLGMALMIAVFCDRFSALDTEAFIDFHTGNRWQHDVAVWTVVRESNERASLLNLFLCCYHCATVVNIWSCLTLSQPIDLCSLALQSFRQGFSQHYLATSEIKPGIFCQGQN